MNENTSIRNYTILLSILVAILLMIGSYAFFQYSKTGVENSKLLAGNVWLKYSETGNTVALNNKAFPETAEEARADGRTDNILSFNIEGLNNTPNKDIYYEIKLLYGPDNQEGRVRIDDKYLRFDLEETVDGVTTRVLDSVSYDSINNTRIYVNTVKSGETVARSYTLRAWISDEVLISDTRVDASYTTEQYRNLYCNVKVMVYGDFNEKSIPLQATELIKSKLGTDGLVAINTSGTLSTGSDTIREYRYSGNGRYCTYTNSETTYTLNVESYESTCPNACLNSNYIIHKTSDYISSMGNSCSTELTANETVPNEGPVKNYIRYNNELWRIIGVFNETVKEETTGSETNQEVIKIVKDTPISADAFTGTGYTYSGTTMKLRDTSKTSPYSYFYWNKSKYFSQTNMNDWTKAALQYYLNDESGANSYYNSIEASERERIVTAKYYLGNVPYNNIPANTAYTEERGTNIWSGNSAYWYGKIGLMYPSDYGYAADSENWTTAMYNYYKLTNTGSQQNWLRDEAKGWEWFISPCTNYSNMAMVVFFYGYVDSYYVDYNLYTGVASPVLYLKSETTISGGSGAYNDPYILG